MLGHPATRRGPGALAGSPRGSSAPSEELGARAWQDGIRMRYAPNMGRDPSESWRCESCEFPHQVDRVDEAQMVCPRCGATTTNLRPCDSCGVWHSGNEDAVVCEDCFEEKLDRA